MQEKKQNISPIKQRVSQFVEYLGITKRQFYSNTGISRGTLDNVTGITEDTLAKLLSFYGEINSHWLLTGEGSMLKPDKEIPPEERGSPGAGGPGCPLCREKEKVITAQQRTIDILERELHYHKAINDELASRTHSGQKRKAG